MADLLNVLKDKLSGKNVKIVCLNLYICANVISITKYTLLIAKCTRVVFLGRTLTTITTYKR